MAMYLNTNIILFFLGWDLQISEELGSIPQYSLFKAVLNYYF